MVINSYLPLILICNILTILICGETKARGNKFRTFYFSSQTVRAHWGTLMMAGTARRDFPDIQLNNLITLATRVRILILRVEFS